MRIIMIGHSNVGKTTYMTSMYGAMQSGVNGFTLAATVPDDHSRFLALHRETQRGSYPAPTDQRAQYNFRLCHNGKAFFDFTWVDRRGGAILERANSTEAAELVSDLASCDGLLVFCDAAAAVRGDEDANEMERISQLVGRAMINRSKPMPLGLVLTKADLVQHADTRADVPLLPLVEAAKRNPSIQHGMVRVACGPGEQNVAAPVLFALHYGIRNKASEYMGEFYRWCSIARTEEEKAKEWGGLKDWWRDLNGQRTFAKEAQISRSIASDKWSQWQPLDAAASELDKYLRTVIHT